MQPALLPSTTTPQSLTGVGEHTDAEWCGGGQVEQVEGLEQGLMQEAQRFFVLTQTDNLWKEHLQVGPC